MADGSPYMTRRERILRLAGGGALIAGGCLLFAVSKALDPWNRAAILAIVAIAMGLTYTGQALRGHRHPVSPIEPAPLPPGISVERKTIAVFLGWLLPGLGHFVIGRRAKGMLFFAVITLTFLAGVALAEGRNLSYQRDRIYFYAYVFNGIETFLGAWLTRGFERDHGIPFLQVGFLYSAVASLLNLVALMDLVAARARGPRGASA